MMWLLIAVGGVIAWLAVAGFFLALCHFAGQADDIAEARLAHAGTNVIDLHAFRESPARKAA